MEVRKFPNEVFARLAPDFYFQRHLERNARPTGRQFLETREFCISEAPSGSLAGSLGSAFLRAGNATVACGITCGTTSFAGEGGVYANIEIPRGSVSLVPTGEDQVTTFQLHSLLKAAQLPREQFCISEQLELCLRAQVVVLSRTGPCLDIAWECLVAALRTARVPLFVLNERTLEMEPTGETKPLELPDSLSAHVHSYGLVGERIFADIDGSIEEESIVDRVSIARTANGLVSGVMLDSPNGVTLQEMRKILQHDKSLY